MMVMTSGSCSKCNVNLGGLCWERYSCRPLEVCILYTVSKTALGKTTNSEHSSDYHTPIYFIACYLMLCSMHLHAPLIPVPGIPAWAESFPEPVAGLGMSRHTGEPHDPAMDEHDLVLKQPWGRLGIPNFKNRSSMNNRMTVPVFEHFHFGSLLLGWVK